MSDSVNFKFIGHVRSCYPDKFGVPRQPQLIQGNYAIIELAPFVQPEYALEGVTEFEYFWVLFQFHQNSNKTYHPKVHPPRMGGESTGVFATRSPHRPNAIGLSLVKLVDVWKDLRTEKHGIIIESHDLVNGTPVLDLKPYLSYVESKTESRKNWTEVKKDSTSIEYTWSSESIQSLEKWQARNTSVDTLLQLTKTRKVDLKKIFEDHISMDPRPLVYRENEIGEPTCHKKIHAMRYLDLDLHFEFMTPEKVTIHSLIQL